MFEVDLLNGAGRPRKIRPIDIYIGAAAIFIPVLCLIIVLSVNMNYKNQLKATKQELQDCEIQIKQFSQDVDSFVKLNQQVERAEKNLLEVAHAVTQCVQWSDILKALTDEMPDGLFLKELSVRKSLKKERVVDRNNPDKKIAIELADRTLTISLYGPGDQDSDRDVQSYIYHIQQSPVLANHINGDEIEVVLRQDEVFNKRNLTCYQIECPFKIKKGAL